MTSSMIETIIKNRDKNQGIRIMRKIIIEEINLEKIGKNSNHLDLNATVRASRR